MILLGLTLGKGARLGLFEGLSRALGLLKMKLLQEPTLWSSQSHCESPESHSPMSENIGIIIIWEDFQIGISFLYLLSES